MLHHPEVGRIGERADLTGLAAVREELLSRREPAFCQPGEGVSRALADPHSSRRPLRLVPGFEPGGIRLIRGDSGTTVAVNGEPVAGERELTAAEVDQGAALRWATG